MTKLTDHPQRIRPQASPGALFKGAHGFLQRRRLREATEREPVYLALIRQCPCLKCGLDPASEASHVRYNSGAHGKHNGMGKKPADRFTTPLCAACHRQDKDSLHNIGEALFWHILGIDPLLVCERLYAARGDIVKMRAVTYAAIAERG